MAAISSQHGGGGGRHGTMDSEDYDHNSYSQEYSSRPGMQPPHADEYSTPQPSTFGAADDRALTERPINQLGPFDSEMSRRGNSTASDLQPPKKRQARSGQGAGSSKGHAGPHRAWGKKSEQEIDRENSSNWVHREKLIALEIQDHKERGEPVPQALVDAYRESTGKFHVNLENIQHELTENNLQRHTLRSPEPGSGRDADEEDGGDGDYDEYYGGGDEPFVPEDPRSPHEIAADQEHAASSMYHSPALRSSSSRIPVSKRSPHPVPQEHIERNAPLPRKRSASIGWEAADDGAPHAKPRPRSQSVGSQVLLDDGGSVPSVPSSPSKSRQAKASPRKSSVASRGGKQRAPSGSAGSGGSPANRPTTRDGRPRTAASRPEEPAPWLADMYKPDPRLPQDQQIIPTHAKRILAEEREREEAQATARDRAGDRARARELQRANNAAALQQAPPRSPAAAGGSLPPPPPGHGPIGEVSAYENGRLRDQTRSPGMPPGHGSYSTMPKVAGTPLMGSRMQSPVPDQQDSVAQRMQMQDDDGDEKDKSGCKCCVVM